MKVALVIMLCSAVYGDCMPPVQMKTFMIVIMNV